ncbi:MAG TPA: DUF2612 domain-containing protein, partial [Arenibacter sp.]|nr:DUF2612 domain-containing protein [Arenibacter sp.]
QYTDSPRFLAWLNALLEPSLDIRNALFQVGDITDIDTAQGHNLDVIGDIVGIGRIVPQSIPLKFFGFEGQITADTFGEEGFLIYGSRFREELESAFASTVLADPEYRTLIKAKILKNHSHGTPEDIIKGLNFLLGVNDSMIEDFGGMEIGIVSGRQLTPVEVAMIDILDILPRPAAVKIRRRIMYIPGNYFGFQGQPNAQTWEEEDDPLHLGGIFSEEF